MTETEQFVRDFAEERGWLTGNEERDEALVSRLCLYLLLVAA